MREHWRPLGTIGDMKIDEASEQESEPRVEARIPKVSRA